MLLKPITSEKAIGGIEFGNKMTFLIDPTATKKDVKVGVEKEFNEKVSKINTSIAPDGRKRAIVTFKRKGAAADVASKLKLV